MNRINSSKKHQQSQQQTSSSINHNSNVNSNQLNNSILKFPGLARPSPTILIDHNNTNHNKLYSSKSSDFITPSSSSSSAYSFEQFNASCDDAWNDKIEDKISFTNIEKNSTNSLKNKSSSFGGHNHNQSSILIKEKQKIINNNNTSPESSSAPTSSSFQSSSNHLIINGNNHGDKNNELLNNNSDKCQNNNNNSSTSSSSCSSSTTTTTDPKVIKLKKLLYEDEITDMNQLRTIAWSGISDEDRPLAWKLLLGYVPAQRSKRSMVIENKKIEYQNLVSQYYYNRPESDEIYRQIHIDIPRMQPLITIFQQPIVQGIFERILYIWSIRHPASGYVQGMNDLVTPFFVTYLSEFVPGHSFSNVENFDVSTLNENQLAMIEADSYWSFNKLLDSIQDNYTFAQPGIQRLVNLLSRVVSRVDSKLHEHLIKNSVHYLQFAFRWMNNLLIREIPLRCIIRLWDTYLSEGAITSNYVPSTNFNDSMELNSWSMNSTTPFSSAFHLFVCAAFLRFWSKSLLQEQDFQGLMLRLQNLPTFHWSENEVKLLVADAYQLKYFFTPNHLKM